VLVLELYDVLLLLIFVLLVCAVDEVVSCEAETETVESTGAAVTVDEVVAVVPRSVEVERVV
jgi:hypothetical protein